MEFASISTATGAIKYDLILRHDCVFLVDFSPAPTLFSASPSLRESPMDRQRRHGCDRKDFTAYCGRAQNGAAVGIAGMLPDVHNRQRAVQSLSETGKEWGGGPKLQTMDREATPTGNPEKAAGMVAPRNSYVTCISLQGRLMPYLPRGPPKHSRASIG